MVSISCGEPEPLPPFRPILSLDGWQPYIPLTSIPTKFFYLLQPRKKKQLAKLGDSIVTDMLGCLQVFVKLSGFF